MPIDIHMLAYCGLYCEQCAFKAAHDEQSDQHLTQIPYPFTQKDLSAYNCECCKGFCICGPCKIRPCASAKGLDCCAECSDFPCDHINAFSDDGMPHHAKAVANLHYIRQYGMDAWYKQIEPALACTCGTKQTWYYTCPLHK